MVKMSIIFTIVIYLHCHTRGWHHYVLLCMNYIVHALSEGLVSI